VGNTKEIYFWGVAGFEVSDTISLIQSYVPTLFAAPPLATLARRLIALLGFVSQIAVYRSQSDDEETSTFVPECRWNWFEVGCLNRELW